MRYALLINCCSFTNDAVQNKLSESRNTASQSKWQIIYLIQFGNIHSAELIASLVNLSVHNIYKIVKRYNLEGASALVYEEKGGRRRFLLTTQ